MAITYLSFTRQQYFNNIWLADIVICMEPQTVEATENEHTSPHHDHVIILNMNKNWPQSIHQIFTRQSFVYALIVKVFPVKHLFYTVANNVL